MNSSIGRIVAEALLEPFEGASVLVELTARDCSNIFAALNMVAVKVFSNDEERRNELIDTSMKMHAAINQMREAMAEMANQPKQ